MNLIKNGNILLAFLLEVYAVFILGYWGFNLKADQSIRIIIGLLAPAVLMITWAIWCAPSSNYRLEGRWLILLKCILFGIVSLCLVSMGKNFDAVCLIVLVIVNLTISSYYGTI